MKLLIVTLLMFVISSKSHSQPYNSSYNFYMSQSNYAAYSVTLNSVHKYYIVQNKYQPESTNFDYIGNALAIKDARYKANLNSLGVEYRKLRDLKLINKVQNDWVTTVKKEILKNFENNGAGVDFSISNNYYSSLSYLTWVYDQMYIRDELSLLQEISTTITRLKRDFPYSFYEHKRYKEMMSCLYKLENCKPEDISKLTVEYSLF